MNIIKERKYYYSKIYIQLEIVKCLHHRELCFLRDKKLGNPKNSIRYLMAFNLKFLNRYIKICENNFVNMYHSVAIIENIPAIFDLRNRKKDDRYLEFMNNFDNHITGYDFFVDFDGKENFEKCFQESKEFKKLLENYRVPYYLLNSSLNGFHFVIPYEYLPNMKIKELIIVIRNIIYNISGIYEWNSIDCSIYDIKRVKKVPYSYVCDGTIALPLTDEQFNNFNFESIKCENVLKNITLKERGLLIRTYNLSDKSLKDNVKIFFEEYK